MLNHVEHLVARTIRAARQTNAADYSETARFSITLIFVIMRRHAGTWLDPVFKGSKVMLPNTGMLLCQPLPVTTTGL